MSLINDQVHKTLIIRELAASPLSQSITMSKRTVMERALPHLYIKGAPAGSLKLTVKRDGEEVWSATQTISSLISNCGKTAESYHGFVSFQGKILTLEDNAQYTFELEGVSGYSFSTSDYVAWVKLRDDRTSYAFQFPLSLKLTEIL